MFVKYIHSHLGWHGILYTWAKIGVQDRSEEDRWKLFLWCAVQHCMHTYLSPELIFKYNQLLVPGAPPGGGCGDTGHQKLVQAS